MEVEAATFWLFTCAETTAARVVKILPLNRMSFLART